MSSLCSSCARLWTWPVGGLVGVGLVVITNRKRESCLFVVITNCFDLIYCRSPCELNDIIYLKVNG